MTYGDSATPQLVEDSRESRGKGDSTFIPCVPHMTHCFGHSPTGGGDQAHNGVKSAVNAVQALRKAGLEAAALQLPESLGAHGDVGDLYRRDPGQFKAALAALPESPIPDPDHGFVKDGVFKPMIPLDTAGSQSDSGPIREPCR